MPKLSRLDISDLKFARLSISLLLDTDRRKDLRGSSNKFPDFFRMGTFIDSTHMKL